MGVLLHRTGPQDTLPIISLAYYGTDQFGAAIYDANRAAIGPNPNHLNPGQSLAIPRIGPLSVL